MAAQVLVVVLIIFAAATLREQIVLRRRSSLTWERLVASLQPTRTEGLIKVSSYIGAVSGYRRTDFSEMFAMIGGPEGLRRVQINAVVLLALVAYMESWGVQPDLAEITVMRRDGRKLSRTVHKLKIFSKCVGYHNLAARHLAETAALYCGMIERLLALCEVVHVARYPGLVAAVNW